jgi:hypothetical protein
VTSINEDDYLMFAEYMYEEAFDDEKPLILQRAFNIYCKRNMLPKWILQKLFSAPGARTLFLIPSKESDRKKEDSEIEQSLIPMRTFHEAKIISGAFDAVKHKLDISEVEVKEGESRKWTVVANLLKDENKKKSDDGKLLNCYSPIKPSYLKKIVSLMKNDKFEYKPRTDGMDAGMQDFYEDELLRRYPKY